MSSNWDFISFACEICVRNSVQSVFFFFFFFFFFYPKFIDDFVNGQYANLVKNAMYIFVLFRCFNVVPVL